MRSIIRRCAAPALATSLLLHGPAIARPKPARAPVPAIAEAAGPRHPAPGIESFGQSQHVATGDPIVPPRDYARSSDQPDPRNYDPNEAGRIYDIAYQGIENGQLQFEVRGYNITDLDRPSWGQIHRFPIGQTDIAIRDLSVTVASADAQGIDYSVRLLPSR